MIMVQRLLKVLPTLIVAGLICAVCNHCIAGVVLIYEGVQQKREQVLT